MQDLDTPLPVSSDVIERYRTEGFVRLSGVLDAATLAHYGEEITRLTLALNTQDKPLEDRSTYDRAFLQVMNLWRTSEVVRQFVFGKRIAGIAAALMGVEGVRLYHDQSLYKEPSGGFTPAHADQYYWPMASDRTVTVWIPLQPVPRDMGPLAFYKGSQTAEFGRDLPISDESEAQITAAMEAQGFPIDEQPYALGDVSFHAGWTFHRAGANRTQQPRSVMTMIYMDEAMRLAEPVNHMQAADWNQWCPGAVVGEVIDTPLNPVIWSAA
ncbi:MULTISPECIES: phytanoyl-CoA dioxygenase family protein [unclassified Caulobacter]|uniref:phytanoyl-CoA dioxygenase family protein n=1 Tax=unclassified Caulobacter TaxID=2648921 RepID=UPI000D335A87|nr:MULTISPECIES: phytanoyl-CoA dioxygenase family protein [unclassified Caulobacter]PTS87871.1 phytanoyl-CoA dioxygenase [Caulobacter sp. HMWF009]PTT09373.1 phytanoyl-CoA dioxygenase [Caulobacter sp. HMWF025]